MYKVYCDDKLLHDMNTDDLILISPKLKLKINIPGELSFIIDPLHPFYEDIKEITSYIKVLQNDEIIFAGRPVNVKKDFQNKKKILVVGELSYLSDSVSQPLDVGNKNIRQVLTRLIEHHNNSVEDEKAYAVGMVTVHNDISSIVDKNWGSTLEKIGLIIKKCGGYLQIRHENGVRYIDYLADFMNTNSQVIRFGDNLIDFSNNLDLTNLLTVIIPLGKDNLTIESVNAGSIELVSSAVEKYGIKKKIVKFNDIDNVSALKDKAQQYLQDTQFEHLVITTKAIDLHYLDAEIESIKLLDKIRVYSATHGLNKYFPVSKLSIDLVNPQNNKITLGQTIQKGLSEITKSQIEAVKKEVEHLPSSVLKQAQDNATQLINNATNGYVVTTADEQLIMDTNDKETAIKVWRWNVNGLGYSHNGYNGPYETAITMDGGIVGERIVAGSITGDKLNAGSITVAWNQYTNAIQLEQGQLVIYDGIVHDNKKRAALDEDGIHFYRHGDYLGKLGTNQWNKKPSEKGLTFDLEADGAYINWGAKTHDSDSFYDMKFMYVNENHSLPFSDGTGVFAGGQLHIGCDLNTHEYAILDPTIKFKNVGSVQESFWSNHSNKGLVYRLEDDGKFLSWEAKSNTSDYYSSKLLYVNGDNDFYLEGDNEERFYANRLHILCDLDMHNWSMMNCIIEDCYIKYWNFKGCLTGDIALDEATLKFKNGILIGLEWN